MRLLDVLGAIALLAYMSVFPLVILLNGTAQ